MSSRALPRLTDRHLDPPDRRRSCRPLALRRAPRRSDRIDGSLCFTTGPTERKAKNLAAKPRCILTTGTNRLEGGLDIVSEGDAVRLTDVAALQRLVDAFAAKYPEPFHFTVYDDRVGGEGGEILAFRLRMTTAFGFGRGETYSQTRWRFENV